PQGGSRRGSTRRPGRSTCPGSSRLKPRHRRFLWIGAGVFLLAAAVGLVLNAFQSNLVFFFSPTDVAEHRAPQGRAFRIGGLVADKSLPRQGSGAPRGC